MKYRQTVELLEISKIESAVTGEKLIQLNFGRRDEARLTGRIFMVNLTRSQKKFFKIGRLYLMNIEIMEVL